MGFVMSAWVECGDLEVVFSFMLHLGISLTLQIGSTKVGTFACKIMRVVFGENFSTAPGESKDL